MPALALLIPLLTGISDQAAIHHKAKIAAMPKWTQFDIPQESITLVQTAPEPKPAEGAHTWDASNPLF